MTRAKLLFSLWVSRLTDTGGITLTVPGQKSHHSGDDADKVEHGVGHLALEDPVRVGWRVAGDASSTVDSCHNEIQCYAAHHDQPVNDRLQDRCSNIDNNVFIQEVHNSLVLLHCIALQIRFLMHTAWNYLMISAWLTGGTLWLNLEKDIHQFSTHPRFDLYWQMQQDGK